LAAMQYINIKSYQRQVEHHSVMKFISPNLENALIYGVKEMVVPSTGDLLELGIVAPAKTMTISGCNKRKFY
jgi:hypothetical protein